MSEIDKLDWYSARQEGLGDLYEGLLQKNAEEKKSGAGQYFTPRPLIDAMVAVTQPKLGDVIQDPADDPASVLLARIRAARQAEAGAARPSRRGRPKAAANPEPIDRTAAPAPSEPLPPDLLTQLLRECGALSERALLAASELEPEGFFTQLERELQLGLIRQSREEGQVLLEAVA